VIDGHAFTSTSVPVGNLPHVVAVNPVTNKVYMTSPQTGTMTVIDGATNTPKTVYTTSNQTPSARRGQKMRSAGNVSV
jgi:DNA-binding beta-propeller fold protein YncE